MAWLNESNRTLDGGYGYFVNRTASIAVQQGRRPVQWNEVGPTAACATLTRRLYCTDMKLPRRMACLLNTIPYCPNQVWDHFGTLLPKEAIVHAWNDRDAMRKATAAGYAALNSQGW